jgi:hypothetical protein
MDIESTQNCHQGSLLSRIYAAINQRTILAALIAGSLLNLINILVGQRLIDNTEHFLRVRVERKSFKERS